MNNSDRVRAYQQVISGEQSFLRKKETSRNYAVTGLVLTGVATALFGAIHYFDSQQLSMPTNIMMGYTLTSLWIKSASDFIDSRNAISVTRKDIVELNGELEGIITS